MPLPQFQPAVQAWFAFLAAIDSLAREGAEGRLRDVTRVVYVSPLKALSNDIQRNLEQPLAGVPA